MMRRVFSVLFVLVVSATPLSAQPSAETPHAADIAVPQKRVKTLFLQTLRAPEALSRAAGATVASPPGRSSAGAPSIGFVYWFEVRDESGAVMEAASEQIIRSGEQVRLYVTSNVDGYLKVYRSGPGGEALEIVPADRFSSTGVRINKGTAIAIPSDSSWLELSSEVERLTVVLSVEGPPSGAPARAEHSIPATPKSYQEIAAVELRRGSFIGRDTYEGKPATFVVQSRESGIQGRVLTEIELKLGR